MILKDVYSDLNRKKDNFSGKLRPVVTFEVFPPRDDFGGEKSDKLILELDSLKKFNPAFVSVTYGAGGANREGSLELVKKIKYDAQIEPMPHFTCVCSNKEYVKDYLKDIEALEIKNILALRGDEPMSAGICYRDFLYANELVDYIKRTTDLSIAVAGYPEGHPKSVDLSSDIENLKKKVEAGADAIYTQLFFDNDYFFKYKQLVRDAGINVPIIPGILPILNYQQLQKMVDMCKVEIPVFLSSQLEKYKDDTSATTELGIEFACNQCQELMAEGVEGLHFFILNKAYSVREILEIIF